MEYSIRKYEHCPDCGERVEVELIYKHKCRSIFKSKAVAPIEEKQEEKITQSDVVWHTSANYDDTADSQHCYKAVKRKTPWGDDYDSNTSLCNKNRGISEDGESFVNISKIEPHKLHRNFACKKCQQIYDRLSLSPPKTVEPEKQEQRKERPDDLLIEEIFNRHINCRAITTDAVFNALSEALRSSPNREDDSNFKVLFDKHYGEGMFDYGLHLSPTSAMHFFNRIQSLTSQEEKPLREQAAKTVQKKPEERDIPTKLQIARQSVIYSRKSKMMDGTRINGWETESFKAGAQYVIKYLLSGDGKSHPIQQEPQESE